MVPGVPTQVFQAAPFALMIIALLLVTSEALDRLAAYLPPRLGRAVTNALHGSPPESLGTVFSRE